MRKFTMATIAAAMMVPTAMPIPAMAGGYHRHRAHSNYYQGRMWQDSQGRWRCKRSNGTTGLIIGAAGGALVGRAIDTHGERATGTILGAAAGALVGRQIQRSTVHCH